MQRNKMTFTVNNFATIFHVQNSTIHKHLEKNGLKNKLLKDGHMKHAKGKTSKYYFDDMALVELSKTFLNSSRIEPSKSIAKDGAIHSDKKILKKLNSINGKMDIILNHLHLNY